MMMMMSDNDIEEFAKLKSFMLPCKLQDKYNN